MNIMESNPNSAVAARITKLVTSALPWIIIAGLLWAGVFIKPQAGGSVVKPSVMERRDYFYGLAVPMPGVIWIAGSSGKLLAVGADGRASRFDTPGDTALQDIAAFDANHAVAVGNGATVLFTGDGGKSWRAADDVPRSQIANKLNRVRVTAEGVAVAVGEMGALLMSRDFGKSWVRLRPEEDVAWNDVALLEDGRLRVVGEFGRMLASDDGGATWREQQAPVKTSLMAVFFRDATHGVAVGLDGVVLVTQDAGRVWAPASVDAHDHLFDIAWDEVRKRWIGAGALGRWVSADSELAEWRSGRLDPRDLSWHTRVVPTSDTTWFAGANVGRWDGSRWAPLAP